MSGSPYSALKIIHHPERIASLRAGRQIAPTQVQLIISDLCNQDCGFCAYRANGYSSNQLFAKGVKLASFGHNNPVRMIEYPKVLEILDDCKAMGVGAIQITGGGEPSVHPQFVDIVQNVLDRGLDLALVSNGVNLNSRSIELLSGAQWVRISIDAGTVETYCRVRRVSETHWNKVWNNLSALCQAKRGDLVIGVGFVVTQENYREIAACTARAREAGADNVRISALFQDEEERYFEKIYPEVVDQCLAAKQLQTDSFRVYDNFGEWLSDLRQHSPDYQFCGFQQFTTYIGGDLNVYRCCVLAYNAQGLIGSLKEQTFRELWESQKKRDDFVRFDARHCVRCMFNEKNRTILYAIDAEPVHVNFV